MPASRCVEAGMEAFDMDTLCCISASRFFFVSLMRGVSAGGGGGQPGAVLSVARARNSTLSSCPAPGNRASRACSLSAWMRPRKSIFVVTSLHCECCRGRAISSLRCEQLFGSCRSWRPIRTGWPDIIISRSVWACRCWKSARISARRSASICLKASFHVSSFWMRCVIARMAWRSRLSTSSVKTFFSCFAGFSSSVPSNVLCLSCTSRRACRCGAQLEAASNWVRLTFRL
mmetsp:Transcript_1154/g.2851  ORF Transcript_1154/g.2851 Transcript_1154/m.2851 type:complete len:231 (+) Transcript_1154:629-1321(+)